MTDKEKTIMDLNLEDDFLFAEVMSDMEICRKVLEKILNVLIKKVEVPTTQKTINVLYESKGIRLDYSDFRFIPINLFKERIHKISKQVYRNNYFNNLVLACR